MSSSIVDRVAPSTSIASVMPRASIQVPQQPPWPPWRATTHDRPSSLWEPAGARSPALEERHPTPAGTMSGGQQASLSVARALINEPRLILVDEPSAGLSPVAQLELRKVLQVVKDSGVTMVLVEQNIAFGLSLVDDANLLQTGTVVYSSPVGSLDNDTLATHLGIGKVLAGVTGSALKARRSS